MGVRAQFPKGPPRAKDEGCVLAPGAGEKGNFVTVYLIPAGWSRGTEKTDS